MSFISFSGQLTSEWLIGNTLVYSRSGQREVAPEGRRLTRREKGETVPLNLSPFSRTKAGGRTFFCQGRRHEIDAKNNPKSVHTTGIFFSRPPGDRFQDVTLSFHSCELKIRAGWSLMVRRAKRQNIRPNAFGVCFTFLLARNPKACFRKKKKAEERKSVNRCVTCKRQRALQQNGGKGWS